MAKLNIMIKTEKFMFLHNIPRATYSYFFLHKSRGITFNLRGRISERVEFDV